MILEVGFGEVRKSSALLWKNKAQIKTAPFP
ncbi:hypothetical protein predicted by Glimmer/Critica [Bdellovibrio bacteriovorus HD100]|uniref:Uncharacterized protein n=1 Tax=Bdellovibrio bacteriovorus (strain ATCC 15356 / DSM 50701 / NCIMB 9529 / HD100) TaxID=264462 RepID=Q6MLZ5_BDEBA|nr:hypothetical protein predicted by Glimmer/Critica [Bdellovibrio bacteriovorus HD100]